MNRIWTKALLGTALLGTSLQPLVAQTRPADPLAPTARWSANTRGNAPTPPMGWNSWNAFEINVDEEKVMGTAEALVETGLAKLGYRYVNIDDGWWLKRRQPDGRMQIRTNLFPSAKTGGPNETSFRPFTDKLHLMGLKAGIYSDMGRNSCGQSYNPKSPNNPAGSIAEREIGLLGYVDKDIKLYFQDWGFDYIKVDACGLDDQSETARRTRGGTFAVHEPVIYRNIVNRTDIKQVKALYQSVGDALAKNNPDNDYIFSLCNWGSANVRAWGKDIGNLFRTSDDIRPTWTRMLHTFDTVANRPLYAKPNAWHDPDMLFVGHGEFDEKHLTEARSHFTLWAMANAPLLIGYDMRKAPKSLLDIWGNADLIRANQDPGGHQAVLAYHSADIQIFVKSLADTDRKIVAVFNRSGGKVDVALLAKHLKFDPAAPIILRDLWSKKTLAPFTGEKVLSVDPRETFVFEATGTRALVGGHYLSELPGVVNVAHDGVVVPMHDPVVHRGVSPWWGTRSTGDRPQYAGWGGAMIDETPYGLSLHLDRKAIDHGIGILANSRLEIRNQGYSRFEAMVGVDDSTANLTAPVVFSVYADGKLIAKSPAMKFGSVPYAMKADIGSAKIVELVARQTGEAKLPATVAWANAALMR